MPVKCKKKDFAQDILISLPKKDDPNYFQALVRNCVVAYEKLSNDGLALDFCKVKDRKLRAMILSDDEYKVETRNIYARQRLEEMEELEYLASLAANGDGNGDEDDDHYEPRDGKKPSKKLTGADKDMISMRFRAAQMKRELRAEMSKMEGDNERDTVNFMSIYCSREELERLVVIELNQGSDDADMDALIGVKEAVPVGISGNLQNKGKMEVSEDDDAFDVLPNGEIVEK